MPTASNQGTAEAFPFVQYKAFALLYLPLSLCPNSGDSGKLPCYSKLRINGLCLFSFGWPLVMSTFHQQHTSFTVYASVPPFWWLNILPLLLLPLYWHWKQPLCPCSLRLLFTALFLHLSGSFLFHLSELNSLRERESIWLQYAWSA